MSRRAAKRLAMIVGLAVAVAAGTKNGKRRDRLVRRAALVALGRAYGQRTLTTIRRKTSMLVGMGEDAAARLRAVLPELPSRTMAQWNATKLAVRAGVLPPEAYLVAL